MDANELVEATDETLGLPTVDAIVAEEGPRVDADSLRAIAPGVRMDLGGIPSVANFAFPTGSVGRRRLGGYATYQDLASALPADEKKRVAWSGDQLVRVERRPNGQKEIRDGIVYDRYVTVFRPIALSVEEARRTGKADYWDGWTWLIGGLKHAKDHPANLGNTRGNEEYELEPASPAEQAAYAMAQQKLQNPDLIAAATSSVEKAAKAPTIKGRR